MSTPHLGRNEDLARCQFSGGSDKTCRNDIERAFVDFELDRDIHFAHRVLKLQMRRRIGDAGSDSLSDGAGAQ